MGVESDAPVRLIASLQSHRRNLIRLGASPFIKFYSGMVSKLYIRLDWPSKCSAHGQLVRY